MLYSPRLGRGEGQLRHDTSLSAVRESRRVDPGSSQSAIGGQSNTERIPTAKRQRRSGSVDPSAS